MSVTVEKNGPVTTIILSRPKVRNAVDRPAAQALAGAFRAFEADEEALVGVFYGDNGTFCAGADLKAIAAATSGATGWNRMATGRWGQRAWYCPSRSLPPSPVTP